jgi:mannose-6-phosphate isomerase
LLDPEQPTIGLVRGPFNQEVTRLRPLLPARVYRFYRGGQLLGELRGRPEPDGFFPEDWIGSVTEARNPGRDDPEAGLSRLRDGPLLRDAIASDPESWLGAKHFARFGATPGFLVKLLDAAQRLPVHAHPDRAFAREHLRSPFGKTEAWIVLATRQRTAPVWIGLREEVEPERYLGWITHQDREALLDSLHRIDVAAGDVVYVPAGVPHAIGAGVLIAEVQEPTDFSLICEWQGFPIRREDSHVGLGWAIAVGALDLRVQSPVLELPAEARDFFFADEVAEPPERFAVFLVLEGEGSLHDEPAHPGDAFAVPAACTELTVEGDLRILRFIGPEP